MRRNTSLQSKALPIIVYIGDIKARRSAVMQLTSLIHPSRDHQELPVRITLTRDAFDLHSRPRLCHRRPMARRFCPDSLFGIR